MSKREKKKQTALNKLYYIWDGIRRNKKYVNLYAAYSNKRNDSKGWYEAMREILREFNIADPINPLLRPSEIPLHRLKMYFDRNVFEPIPMKIFRHINTSQKRHINLHLTADMTRSVEDICGEFKTFIASVKRNRKKQGLDKAPEIFIDGKKEFYTYNPLDFEWYDFINDFHKKGARLSFYNVAKAVSENPSIVPLPEKMKVTGKEDFLNRDRGDTIHDFYDMKGKEIRSIYNRAKRCIEGGYRVLMQGA